VLHELHFGSELRLEFVSEGLFLRRELVLDTHVLLFVVLDFFLEVLEPDLQIFVLSLPLVAGAAGMVRVLLQLVPEFPDRDLRLLVLGFPFDGGAL
jgi:hypothetical protein